MFNVPHSPQPIVDPIILYIKSLFPPDRFNVLFSFIVDIAFQIFSHRTLYTILHFLFIHGPGYGFVSTLQNQNCMQLTTQPTSLSACPPQFSLALLKPKATLEALQILGTYFFNQQQKTQLCCLLTNTINFFFANLDTLPLTHNEIMNLSNIKLIPTANYRIIYNSLSQDKLDKLDSLIWSHISAMGRFSHCTPNKTEYSSTFRLARKSQKSASQHTHKPSTT